MKYFLLVYLFFSFQFGFSQNDPIIDLGIKLTDQNKFDEAIVYYNKYLVAPKNEEQKVLLLIGLADIYKLKLNYKIANDYYQKAYDITKKIKNVQLEFLYHVKIAEFYRKREFFEKSKLELDKANRILIKNTINKTYLAKYYNRKAALFTEFKHNNDSTLYYARKSLKLAKEIGNKDIVFYSLLEIQGVYERQKKYDKAIIYNEELVEFAVVNNLPQQEADGYVSYIMVLARDNQLNKALKKSFYALEFSEKHNFLPNQIVFTEYIQNIYKRLGNTKKAYDYLNENRNLLNTFNEQQKLKILLEAEAKYNLKEKDNEIKIKNFEIANKNKALESSNTKFYISIALFLVAIAVASFIGYFLKQTKQKNNQLQTLSQENKFLLSEANHRINNNLQLIIILISDQLKKLPKNQQAELNTILKKIDSIATLHRHLYKYPDKSSIDCQKYLKEITINFNDLFKENNIDTEISMDSFLISTDVAMYLGLLFTELCINSIKHAFENQEVKKIKFHLNFVNNQIIFQYSDNGVQNINKSIQPKLIDKLCRQLKVEYEILTLNGFSFSFKKIIN